MDIFQRVRVMKKFILIFIVLAFAVGCAGTRARWYKPGAKQADFVRDNKECDDQAQMAGPSAPSGKYKPGTLREYKGRLWATLMIPE
jgi:hypothetical protein